VYDVSDKKSFENAKNSWLVELQETADDESTLKQCTMLVGNKTDLTPVVNEAEHMASVKSLGLSLSVRIEN
jgi:GTPase SAR1 family protein